MDTKLKILDIAMNLNRVGNWAADDYAGKKQRIQTFLSNTSAYIKDIDESTIPLSFDDTFRQFKSEYIKLEKSGYNGPKDPLAWAESMMTWGNILTHRSKLFI